MACLEGFSFLVQNELANGKCAHSPLGHTVEDEQCVSGDLG